MITCEQFKEILYRGADSWHEWQEITTTSERMALIEHQRSCKACEAFVKSEYEEASKTVSSIERLLRSVEARILLDSDKARQAQDPELGGKDEKKG